MNTCSLVSGFCKKMQQLISFSFKLWLKVLIRPYCDVASTLYAQPVAVSPKIDSWFLHLFLLFYYKHIYHLCCFSSSFFLYKYCLFKLVPQLYHAKRWLTLELIFMGFSLIFASLVSPCNPNSPGPPSLLSYGTFQFNSVPPVQWRPLWQRIPWIIY